jgi:S1-C subfamily serine protease
MTGTSLAQEFVDDAGLRRAIEDNVGRLMEGKKTVDAGELRKQLTRRTCEAVLPPVRVEVATGDHYARLRQSTMVVSGNFKDCGRCDRMHLKGSATGFMISEDGLMVTNHHVIDSEKAVTLVAASADGTVYPVTEILASNPAQDVALVRLEGKGFRPLPIRAKAPVGTAVSVLSHPAGRFYTLTKGAISRYVKRNPHKRGRAKRHRVGGYRMTITADYARGSSGGPVVDGQGRVVGLVASTESIYYSEEDGEQRNLQMVFKDCIPAQSILDLIRTPEPPKEE